MARITKPVSERRQEIIDTARALFIENGFDETQVLDISKKMGVAQGLIYHYFKSKKEIFYAVVDELVEEHRRMTESVLSAANGCARERLIMLLSNQPQTDSYDRLILSIMNDSAIVEYCLNKMTAATLPILCALIEQGNEDGSWSCEYPKETAIFILQGLSGFLNLSHSANVDERTKQAVTGIIIRILGFS